MATSPMNKVIRHLSREVLLREGAAFTDAQLLECFLNRRDEAAFEAIVRRHGPMVMGVCRRVLRNHHDSEDAFQATFLILVRKAASIASRELLAGWLYGVAYRTALKAKAAATKRRLRERQGAEMSEPQAGRHDLWSDLQPLLDEELSRLPDKYRFPLILCDLEGTSHKEAARQLGWPQGTLSGRLARARGLLAKRLTQRGLALSGGSLAVVLAEGMASAYTSNSLVAATVRAASQVAAGPTTAAGLISAEVAALMEGVLQAMLLTKLKVAAAVGLVVALVGIGLLALSSRAPGVPVPPARQSGNKYTPVDLKEKTNHSLNADFHTGNFKGNNLRPLPRGKQKFGGVDFVIGEGYIQLGSTVVLNKPAKVEGIAVGRAFARLHLLHATGWQAPDGTLIGTYTIHYADKTKAAIDIVYGKDVRNWWNRQDPKVPSRGKLVWQGQNEAVKTLSAQNPVMIRLFLTTWQNPHPRKKVISIDYAATTEKIQAAPFCVAITTEREPAKGRRE